MSRTVTMLLTLIAVVVSPTKPVQADSLKNLVIGLFGPEGESALAAAATAIKPAVFFPSIASSFVFEFDPERGMPVRSPASLGPIFADRAETLGRGRLDVGLFFTRFTFDELDGTNLRNGDLRLTLPGPGGGLASRLFIDVTSEAVVLAVTYGVFQNLDVGLGVPVVRNDLQIKAVVAETVVASASGESTGLGDVLVRAKYNFYRQKTLGLAAVLDVLLPTGDEDDFHGLGTPRARPTLVASGQVAGFAPHASVGFDLGDPDKARHELVYTLGFDWAVAKPVTLAFDLLGRYVIDNDRLKLGTGTRAGDHMLSAAVGFKVNPWNNALLVVNLLVALNDTGLRDSLVPLVGIEIAF